MPGYGAPGPDVTSAGTAMASGDSASAIADPALVTADADVALPDQVASVPIASPAIRTASDLALPPPTDAQAIAASTPQQLVQPGQTAEETAAAAEKIAAGDAGVMAPQAKPQQVASANPVMDNPVYVTASDAPPAQTIEPKKKGFLSAFFGSTPAQAVPAPLFANSRSGDQPSPARQAVKPIITLASAQSEPKPTALASLGGNDDNFSGNALPGVRQTMLFEIKRKSGIDDESDVDLNEDDDGPYQVASAAGMARLAPNGLLKQTESVDVACLKPSLVRVLKLIEGHYGKKMIVTSGYRSPDRNRRANGAKNSLHMYCAAADIQVPGVSKWELASYARSMPGRGGVGTYCHTESVHVDVGPERDWNWRCRRRNGG